MLIGGAIRRKPLPLLSKGEKIGQNKMLPSMTKGEIVGNMAVLRLSLMATRWCDENSKQSGVMRASSTVMIEY